MLGQLRLSGFLLCVQDCNLVIYSAGYLVDGLVGRDAVFATKTSGKGNGGFCSMQLSSSQGGTLSVLDPKSNVVFLSSAVPQAPVVSTLSSGQSLQTGAKLFSTNGLYFLYLQADGNVLT